MQVPQEIFKSMIMSDAQFVNNSTRNSFVSFKQKLQTLGFTPRQQNPFDSSDQMVKIKQIQLNTEQKINSSFNKIDEWQKYQDQIMLQISQQKQSYSMYVPNYPIKQKFDLKSRFEQHNTQLNFSLENKLQRTPSLIKNLLDSQIISDISTQQIGKTKDDEQKKKSNLKTSKTVEKKSVKIEEKRKSQSELKKETVTSSKPPKPPKSPKSSKTLKKQKSNSSITSTKKKDKESKPGVETVDSFLKHSNKKKK